ncbi:MAG: hypothetical protein M9905_04270 [Rhizobiaceae bacterium]|nr:hypothetical protein [Rhizobiaceae bacterium]
MREVGGQIADGTLKLTDPDDGEVAFALSLGPPVRRIGGFFVPRFEIERPKVRIVRNMIDKCHFAVLL